jgi:hypothetical protein
MADNPLFWITITGSVTAIFSIAIVFLMMYYVNPALKSPAKYFIEAFRKKKDVIASDCGNYWTFYVATQGDGYFTAPDYKDKGKKIMLLEAPNSVKRAFGGIKFGVAEDWRASIVNPAIVSLIKRVVDEKLEPEQIRDAVEKIEYAVINRKPPENKIEEEVSYVLEKEDKK